MRITAPFGQYVPVASPVHALEPRAKMALAAAYTVLLFTVEGFAGLAFAAVLGAAALAASRVPARLALRGVRTVSILLAFTVAAHSLRWEPATVALLRVGSLGIDGEGLATGLFLALRIVLLVVATSLLTLTTTPVELTDALEKLMRPLRAVGVPVGDVAMMLSIALRFIPTTAEEAEKVIVAQTARGARLGEGGPLRRARAYVPVLVPLFVGLFRRADELATAMEARCYRGGEGRTRLRERRMCPSDWAVLAAGVTLMVAGSVAL
ncbi:MAG: energy-coupling factor transporter transmembrane protein EcfT [Coriobacteriia bacterium]|nr:energy-coupling factor transporter transmembrane protein EcfT [Coriobacteriia bacterium]